MFSGAGLWRQLFGGRGPQQPRRLGVAIVLGCFITGGTRVIIDCPLDRLPARVCLVVVGRNNCFQSCPVFSWQVRHGVCALGVLAQHPLPVPGWGLCVFAGNKH